ncbi:tRNA (guanine(9)-N1)-methyltransferase [Sparassis crispa]|uniref:tRNA (guanine(9)-N1)-methyltransferase n=1 Tax=Sparassis crispa TaxID=139825 RepID=A0A401GD78_9APHY|nr:tRNA (guanine(9)-N1)-methyltransferase [Sparassis crispa]GBE80110.1 tRNA (guanine(9)-N1)-methyltransferase [Sparassis crispa]
MDAAEEAIVDPPAEESPEIGSSSAQGLSKNAQKRLAKAARRTEQKKERRAAEKERKKEKKRVQAEKRVAGELDEEVDGRSRKKRRIDEQKGLRQPFGARVVVDLGFDDLMSEKEIISLTSQLAYTSSANRKAIRPFASLLFTSLNGRTFTRLENLTNAAYKRWVDTEWWTEGYEQLWEDQKAERADVEGVTEGGEKNGNGDGKVHDATGKIEGGHDLQEADAKFRHLELAQKPQTADRETVVYLTADSPEELTELNEGKTYIIGGICDHNRYKNLCQKKSVESGVRSARLPIGTYLSTLRTRKVLTVNQTIEILLKWIETRDWEKAFWDVIPKRKFQEKRSRNGAVITNEENESDADAEGAQNGDDGVERMVIDVRALEEAETESMDGGEEPKLPDIV